MTSMKEVRSANDALKGSRDSITAVFVGATSGIGKATLQSFAKHIPKAKAIIVGRSRGRFAAELEHLKSLNPAGDFTFLEADVSLIKNINAVCAQIKQHTTASTCYSPRRVTSASPAGKTTRTVSTTALPSVTTAASGSHRTSSRSWGTHARVVTVLAGGQEGKIFEDDLDLERNYSIGNAANQFATMLTLAHDKLAEQNPDKAFLHIFPGVVSTGLLGRSATGILGYVFRYLVEPILGFFVTKPEEVGERMLYYATTERYSAGSWSLDADGTPKEVKPLIEYREALAIRWWSTRSAFMREWQLGGCGPCAKG